MPVLATIATINLLFGSTEEDTVSFLNPSVLRERCKEIIEDTDKRAKAVILTDELQQLSARYRKAVLATVDTYIDKSVEWDSSADELIEIITPMDHTRSKTLNDIIQIRQSMRELLTSEQWHKLFS